MQMAIDVAGFDANGADELRRAMGLQALRGADGPAARAALPGHGRQRHHRCARRRPLRQALRVRQLRLPGEPRDELRVPRLRQRLVQALPPGPPSAPRWSTRSRWASTPPRLSSTTRAGTGCRCAGRTSTPATPPPPWSRPLWRVGRATVRGATAGLGRRRPGGAAGPVRGAHDRRRPGERIQAERERGGPYRDMRDLARRLASVGTPISAAQMEALATADAFVSAPRAVGTQPAGGAVGGRAAARSAPTGCRGPPRGTRAPLPGMDEVE
jgi:error-prone DNA polymerase